MQREPRESKGRVIPGAAPVIPGAAPVTPGAAPEGSREGSAEEEHEWVRAAQAGSEEGFERLVRAHQARAWRVARNMVPSDEDARDLVQEAFLRVFKHLDRFDFRHPFATWLYRIVTNLSIDHLRQRRPTYSTTSSDEDEDQIELHDPSAASPAARLEGEETAGEVRSCLDALAPHFQSALVLRELEGLPCTEIAEIVGATHVTVRWRLHRGRKLFQEEWERRERLRVCAVEEGDPSNRAPSNRAEALGGRVETDQE